MKFGICNEIFKDWNDIGRTIDFVKETGYDGLEIAPLLAVIAAITIAYLIFHPSTRYRAPADPFVFILAAYALASVWAARIAPRWGRAVDRT